MTLGPIRLWHCGHLHSTGRQPCYRPPSRTCVHSRVRYLDAIGLEVHQTPRDLLAPRLGDVTHRSGVEHGRAQRGNEERMYVLRAHKRRKQLQRRLGVETCAMPRDER
jgi:hypothetical protein